MQNKFLCFLLFVISSTVFFSCGKDPLCNCFESTGESSTEDRIMDAFTVVEPFNNVDVNLHHSNTHLVRVRGGKNLIDGIETTVENGILQIRNKNRCNWMRDPANEFIVDVFSPEIKTVICRTVGDIRCLDTINTSVFTAESWDGYGTIDLKLHCDEAYLKIHTGPVDLVANGISNYTYLYNTGNGYIRANGLRSNDAYVMSRSTGDCHVNCNNTLKVKIEYQGDIYYSGQPPVIDKDITGTGKLIAY